MRNVVRLVIIVTLAALGLPARAAGIPSHNIASNGVGDGEANVPFASSFPETVVIEAGRESGEPVDLATVAVENLPFASNALTAVAPLDAARARWRAEWMAQFEQQVWTAP